MERNSSTSRSNWSISALTKRKILILGVIFVIQLLSIKVNAQAPMREVVPVKSIIKSVRTLLDYTTNYLELK